MKKYKDFLLENLTPKVKLEFPELRQNHNFDCGVTALQSVLIYYGIEKRGDELLALLKSTKKYGTDLNKIVEVSEYFGLEAKIIRHTSIKDLKKFIDEGIPPILLLQAWREYDGTKWKNDYKNGHYVVAIGYNNDCIFFEDPSSTNVTYLTFKELEERWHDIDDDYKTKNNHVSIIIKGEKKYKKDEIIHMD